MVEYFKELIEAGKIRVAVMLYATKAEVAIPFQ